ncbi:MAG: phage major capsid protein, partial [Candidatus Angelobacter sp.]
MPDKAAILAEASTLIHKVNFSREDSARVDSLLRLADQMSDKTELRRASLHERGVQLGRITTTPPEELSDEDRAFRHFLLTGEYDSVKMVQQYRAQGLATGAAGLYIAPASFSNQLEVALKQYDGLFDASTYFPTARGTTMGYPIVDDATKSASIVAENNPSAAQDLVFSNVVFGSDTWRSGITRVSIELMNDSAFDLTALLADAFAIRFARGIGRAFVSTLIAEATKVGSTLSAAATGDDLWT